MADDRIALRLLGPPAFGGPGRTVSLLELRPKATALLARLALVEGPQERALLADLLFPNAANPRDTLRWYLSYLRSRFPEAIVVDRRRVSSRLSTDVQAFRSGAQRILNDSESADAATTLSLYRGDLCAGLRVLASTDFHNWLYVQEDELRRTFRRAAVAYARSALARGRPAMAIPCLQRLTDIDPYLEEGHVLLVETYEAADRSADARHAYDRYQRVVRNELHAEPRPQLALRYEPEQPPGRGLPLDELVPLDEITMHVVDWPGEEPAILAIHGSAGHAYQMTTLGERLAPGVRFLAVDLRGHGFSDKPPGGYGVAEHVNDILELVAALGLRRPILLGHSIGGAIATFAAATGGDRFGGLILFDAVVGDRQFVESASFVVEEFGPMLEQRFAAFDDYHGQWGSEARDPVWKGWLERSDRMELVPLPDGTLRRRGLRQALAAEWASVAQEDALAALERIRQPVLVVHANGDWGEKPYLDEATICAQLAAARHPRLYTAEGQHHGEIVRNPSQGLMAALNKFIKDTRSNEPAAKAVRR